MSEILQYVYFEGNFSNMANMADGVITYQGDTVWCKYSDHVAEREADKKRIAELETMFGHRDITVARVDGDRNGEGLPDSLVLKRGDLYRTYETTGTIQ